MKMLCHAQLAVALFEEFHIASLYHILYFIKRPLFPPPQLYLREFVSRLFALWALALLGTINHTILLSLICVHCQVVWVGVKITAAYLPVNGSVHCLLLLFKSVLNQG